MADSDIVRLTQGQIKMIGDKIKEAGGGGGITTLTTADYNWPTTGTKTAINAALLDAGIYIMESGVKFYYGNFDGWLKTSRANGMIIKTGDDNANTSRVLWCLGGDDGIWYMQTGSNKYALLRTPVINALNSTSTDNALSANQGVVLKGMIGDLASLTTANKTSTVMAINELDAELGDSQSDWEENDSTSLSFIKNKPFGEVTTENTMTFTGTSSEMRLSWDYIYIAASSGDSLMLVSDFLDTVGWQASDITSLGYTVNDIFLETCFSGAYSGSGTAFGSKWKELPALIDAGYNKINLTTVYEDWEHETSEDLTYKFTMNKVSEGVYISSLSDLVSPTSYGDSSKLVRIFGLFKYGAVKNKITLDSYTSQHYTITDDDVIVFCYLLNSNSYPVPVWGGGGAGLKDGQMTLSGSSTTIKQIDAEYIPIDNDTIINDDGVLKAAGGIITLTTADYNYPSSGTKTAIALSVIPSGVYTAGETLTIIQPNGVERSVYKDAILVVSGENDGNHRQVLYSQGSASAAWRVVDSTGIKLQLEAVDNLSSTGTNYPLSANQGRVLNEKIEGRILNGGTTAPTTSTVGSVGTQYNCVNNGTPEIYICTDTTGGTYTWTKIN